MPHCGKLANVGSVVSSADKAVSGPSGSSTIPTPAPTPAPACSDRTVSPRRADSACACTPTTTPGRIGRPYPAPDYPSVTDSSPAELEALLAPVLLQARSRLTAFAYIGALLAERGDRKSWWQLGETAGHRTPRRMQALLAEYASDWKQALTAVQRFIVTRLVSPRH